MDRNDNPRYRPVSQALIATEELLTPSVPEIYPLQSFLEKFATTTDPSLITRIFFALHPSTHAQSKEVVAIRQWVSAIAHTQPNLFPEALIDYIQNIQDDEAQRNATPDLGKDGLGEVTQDSDEIIREHIRAGEDIIYVAGTGLGDMFFSALQALLLAKGLEQAGLTNRINLVIINKAMTKFLQAICGNYVLVTASENTIGGVADTIKEVTQNRRHILFENMNFLQLSLPAKSIHKVIGSLTFNKDNPNADVIDTFISEVSKIIQIPIPSLSNEIMAEAEQRCRMYIDSYIEATPALKNKLDAIVQDFLIIFAKGSIEPKNMERGFSTIAKQLIPLCKQNGLQVFYQGNTANCSAGLAEFIQNNIPVNEISQTGTIEALLAYILHPHARAVIGADTGPVHFAELFLPTIDIHVNSDGRFWRIREETITAMHPIALEVEREGRRYASVVGEILPPHAHPFVLDKALLQGCNLQIIALQEKFAQSIVEAIQKLTVILQIKKSASR